MNIQEKMANLITRNKCSGASSEVAAAEVIQLVLAELIPKKERGKPMKPYNFDNEIKKWLKSLPKIEEGNENISAGFRSKNI